MGDKTGMIAANKQTGGLMTEQPITAETMPPGDYAIVELFGYTTLVGRVSEIERFGTKMLMIEPLFNNSMLGPVMQGGGSIYRLTPCTSEVAFSRMPVDVLELPQAILSTLAGEALPGPQTEEADLSNDVDLPF